MAETSTRQRRPKSPPTPRQLEIRKLQGTDRKKRSAEQHARLATLQAEERRDRFVRLLGPRVSKLKTAINNLIRMGNPTSYQYTQDEAAAIVDGFAAWTKDVAHAFKGTPKERGMFDL